MLWQKRQNSHRLLSNSRQMWEWPAGSVSAPDQRQICAFPAPHSKQDAHLKTVLESKAAEFVFGHPGSLHPRWDFTKHYSTANVSHWFSIVCKSHLWFLELGTNNCFGNTLSGLFKSQFLKNKRVNASLEIRIVEFHTFLAINIYTQLTQNFILIISFWFKNDWRTLKIR